VESKQDWFMHPYPHLPPSLDIFVTVFEKCWITECEDHRLRGVCNQESWPRNPGSCPKTRRSLWLHRAQNLSSTYIRAHTDKHDAPKEAAKAAERARSPKATDEAKAAPETKAKAEAVAKAAADAKAKSEKAAAEKAAANAKVVILEIITHCLGS
jgi:polyphosphate kinase 2 (PPK2 family)